MNKLHLHFRSTSTSKFHFLCTFMVHFVLLYLLFRDPILHQRFPVPLPAFPSPCLSSSLRTRSGNFCVGPRPETSHCVQVWGVQHQSCTRWSCATLRCFNLLHFRVQKGLCELSDGARCFSGCKWTQTWIFGAQTPKRIVTLLDATRRLCAGPCLRRRLAMSKCETVCLV